MRIPELFVHLGPVSVSAHVFLEAVAYAIGFAIYHAQKQREGDILSQPNRNSVIVAAILGAAIGSKVLAWLEDPVALSQGLAAFWPGGKTIVGGLLGGTIAVEWEKRRQRISARTGDLFAIPIATGVAMGRIGCLFGGVNDHTAGIASNLPWAMDFGDGVRRHPTQLYEIVFLMILVGVLRMLRTKLPANGDLFRVFLFSYLAWRFAIDFLKPDPAFAGLESIQWCCLVGLLWYSRDIARILGSLSKHRAGAYANG